VFVILQLNVGGKSNHVYKSFFKMLVKNTNIGISGKHQHWHQYQHWHQWKIPTMALTPTLASVENTNIRIREKYQY